MKSSKLLCSFIALGCVISVHGYSFGGGDNGPEAMQIRPNPSLQPVQKPAAQPKAPPIKPDSGRTRAEDGMVPVNPSADTEQPHGNVGSPKGNQH
jgi:hypothetical protein